MHSTTLAPSAPTRAGAWLVWQLVIVLAIAAPWLSPLSWGPNPEMAQRLLSAACTAVLLVGLAGGARPDARTLAHGVAMGWLLAALLSAVAGLLQYFDVGGLSPWVSGSSVGQAYANLRQRNQFASLTTLGLLALLYLITTRTDTRRLRLRQAATLLALALLALGNAASSSRTGVLQWLAVALMAWVWTRHGPRSARHWSLLALAFYLGAALLLPALLQVHNGVGGAASALERFQEYSGCGDRSVLWRNVLELIAQKPWGGWGWGELKFAHFIYPYPGARFCEILDNAHNLPLHLAVTLGLPLALLLCGTLLWAVLRARPWRETDAARQMAWAALAAIGLHSLLEYPLWYGPFQMAVGLSLWLLWRARTVATPSPSGAARGAVLVLAAGLLGGVAYAGWDYWRVGQLYLLPAQRAAAYRDDTLNKVRDSWLFGAEVRFAQVTTSTPTPDNAAELYAAALQTLHFSPEPSVVAVLLSSAGLLGDHSALVQHIRARWRAVYGAEAQAAD